MKSVKSLSLPSRWAIGIGFSVALIWIITALFTAKLVPEEWSLELKRNVRASGWTITERTEGWASSSVYEHGLIGSPLRDHLNQPKVLIWGDSFVEAIQVADDDKMHRQLARLLASESGLRAVGIGEPWWSVADHIVRLPDYERTLQDVRLHVIHLNSLEDTFPDQYPGARVSLFLSEPDLRFEKYDNEIQELEPPTHSGSFANSLYRLRLQFFLHLRTRLIKIASLDGLRFSLGIAQESGDDPFAHRAWNRFLEPSWGAAEAPMDAWRFLLRELDATTEIPILFVYAPPTPALADGSVILANPEKNLADHFASLCREQGIGFVNLEEPFLRFWNEERKFPKGFQNSRPWEGHYNADGHRLVAETIHSWIQENRHVVYPD